MEDVANSPCHALSLNSDHSVWSAVRLVRAPGDVEYPFVEPDHHATQMDTINVILVDAAPCWFISLFVWVSQE